MANSSFFKGLRDKATAAPPAATTAAVNPPPVAAPPPPPVTAPAAPAVAAPQMPSIEEINSLIVELAAANILFMDGTVEGGQIPPWANPRCLACRGKAFNSAKGLCNACVVTAAERGVLGPQYFEIAPNKWTANRGMLQMEMPLLETLVGLLSAPAPTSAPAAAPAAPAPDSGPPAGAVAIPVTTTFTHPKGGKISVTEGPAEGADEGDDDKKKMGRKEKTFTLIVGGAVYKWPNMSRTLLALSDLMKLYEEWYTKTKGLESYWGSEAFRRWDCMPAFVELSLDDLKGKVIVAPSVFNQDEKSMTAALMKSANEVIVATALN